MPPGAPIPPAQPYTFGRPTDVTWDPQGNIFVSDGYTNSRVAKYDKNGRFIASFGTKGNGQDQLNLPHSMAMDANGNALGVLSTVQLAPVAASNGVGTLAKELAYANSVTGLGLQVATGTTPFSSVPLPPAQHGPAADVPDANGALHTPGQGQVALRRESHALDAPDVPLQATDHLTGLHIPQVRRRLRSPGQSEAALGGDGDVVERIVVSPVRSDLAAVLEVPEAQAPVLATREGLVAAG